VHMGPYPPPPGVLQGWFLCVCDERPVRHCVWLAWKLSSSTSRSSSGVHVWLATCFVKLVDACSTVFH
jgi:hypothetical protein